MIVKLTKIVIALMLLDNLQTALSTKKGYYTIVAPATVRPESVFHVSFTLNDFHKSCWFNITLNGPNNNKIYASENVEVKPGTTKLVELEAPSFNNTYGFLEVLGYSGIISHDLNIIFFGEYADEFWTFIQTDKAMYKQNELVQFRIICFDQLTRPAKLKDEMTVEIYDGDNNLIRIFSDIKFVQGVFRGEFQLSEYPSLGKWIITASTTGRTEALQMFKVDRYVLPKFNIEIKTKEVSIYDEKIVLDISASYFYGKSVKGNLSWTMTNTHAPYHAPYPKKIQTITNESPIDGNTTILIDLKYDLQLSPGNDDQISTPLRQLYTFYLEAVVIDESSEEQSRTGLDIWIYNKPYKIKLEAPKAFDSDTFINLKIKVSIEDLNGNSIEDTKNPIEIIVGCKENSFQDADLNRIEYRNEVGKDFGIIQITNKNYTECFLYAEYRKTFSTRRQMKNKPKFEMDILTESPQQGKELEVKIKHQDPIKEFSYEIVSRGDIIKSDHVKIPGNATTFVFRFDVTSEMIPKITIYVHLINKMNFIGKLKDVFINKPLSNSIEITTEKQTKPGKSVNVNVTTDVGSYVGLMGIDLSAMQSQHQMDIFNEDIVNQQIANYLNAYPDTIEKGRTGDIITFSNVLPTPSLVVVGEDIPHRAPEYIRKLFPESWLFKDFERTSAGSFNVFETVPDTITTWVITGFSINPKTGLTFTKNTTMLRVFQDLFISMDLPNLVREDEIIQVPVIISNYMNKDTLTSITIESNTEGLVFLEKPEDISSKPKLSFSKLISANKRDQMLFFMKPLKQGHYNVTVKAIYSERSDTVQNTLNVEPQGVSYAFSKTYLVYLPQESTQDVDITIDIPENAIPESQRISVSVVGDIFRPLMEKLQKLVQVPYGNGEDNMKLIVSNLIVLKYLKTLNYSNANLENKIKENLELGYQNQLSFKYQDGSFGLFQRLSQKSRTGDIWQTIFTLWGLKQAHEFIHVETTVLNRGLDYLKLVQQDNGCFKSKSGIDQDIKLTAFGVIVFLLDKNSSSTYNEVIIKALEFLNENVGDLEDSSNTAMATYALTLGKHEKAVDHLKKLTSNSPLTSEQRLWTKTDTFQSYIETTAGSLINLLQSHQIPEQSILQIVRRLIVSKTEEPSITHMVALQAMIGFLEKIDLNSKNLNIVIKDDRGKSTDFGVNAENSKVFQTFEISKSSRKINLQSKGQGFAVIDVRYNYNVFTEDQSSLDYNINVSTKNISKHLGVLKICSSINYKNHNQSKLTTMEVHLQSSFIFTEKGSSDDETSSEDIKSIQVDNSRNKMLMNYELLDNEVCIEMEVRKSYKVFNSKPGLVIIYDAHNKDQKATKVLNFIELG